MPRSIPPGLKAERNNFIEKELVKNPNLSFDKCIALLKEKNLAGIGNQTFSDMKKLRAKEPMKEGTKPLQLNESPRKTLDIDVSGEVQYTAIRFMKGKSVIAELPMMVRS